MFEYLVTSRIRRELLRLLWIRRTRGSMRELALACGFSTAAVRRELELMERAGLAESERVGNAHLFRANHESEHAGLLLQLLGAPTTGPTVGGAPYGDDVVRGMLAEYGAPFVSKDTAEGRRPKSPEELLAYALRLSHRDPHVALVFPQVLHRNWSSLDRAALRHWVNRVGEKQALGFYLELTGELAGEEDYLREAERFRDRRFRKVRSYFPGLERGRLASELAQLRSPDCAGRWHYRMNLPMESFEGHFRRFSRDRAGFAAGIEAVFGQEAGDTSYSAMRARRESKRGGGKKRPRA
jgi:hypothetical protein